MDAPTVSLGGHEATLMAPSPLLAYALADASGGEDEPLAVRLALGAAALVACWPEDTRSPLRPRPRPWRAGEDIVDYGHPIFDRLLGAGVPVREVVEHGIAARAWAMSGLVTEQEVAEAEGFSGALEEG